MKLKLWLVGLSALFSSVLSAQNGKNATVYIFGYSTAFNDSAVVLTSVQPLHGVTLEAKTGFLPGREIYSRQLKAYLESRDSTPQTCAVFFAKTRAKLEKKYAAVRYRMKMNKNIKLRELSASDFTFVSVARL